MNFKTLKKIIPFYFKFSFYIIMVHTFGDNTSFYIAMVHLRNKLEQDFYSLLGNNDHD